MERKEGGKKERTKWGKKREEEERMVADVGPEEPREDGSLGALSEVGRAWRWWRHPHSDGCPNIWVSGVVGGEGSDLPGTWTPPSNVGKIRGREGEDSGSSSYHRGFMVEADGAWGSRQK